MSSPQALLETRDVNDVTIIKILAKRLMDEPLLQKLGERLFPIVETQSKKKIVLDLSDVEYISSSGRGKLIAFYKKVMNLKGRLVTYGAQENVAEVFQITRLDKCLRVVLDEQTALIEIEKEDPIQIANEKMIATARLLLELAGSTYRAKEIIDKVAGEK